MNILIALDGSPSARHALDFAVELLADRKTAVRLVHIIPEHLIYGKAGTAPVELYDMPKERAASKELLEQSEQHLRDAGVGPDIEKQLGVGDPADLILTAAKEMNADLIVLGSRGLNTAQRFLIGSVSNKVATHAHCAVMVVRPATTTTGTEAEAQAPAAQ